MKSISKWLVGAACVAASLSNVQSAKAAAEDKEKGKPGVEAAGSAHGSVGVGAEASAPAPAEGGATSSIRSEGAHDEAAHEGEHEEEAEARLSLGVDFVLGVGKSDVVQSQLPASLATQQNYERAVAKWTTESFVLAAGYELSKNWGIGLRLPFSVGTFAVDDQQSRGTGALGNIELEGEYERELSRDLEFVFALGVALPTAQGDELPEAEKLAGLPFSADINSYDRFALQKAVAASRGYEDNALFEPKHLGIIPKVGLEWRPSPKVEVQPYVKLENLIATTDGQAHSYTGELVGGARAGFHVSKEFEPGVRVWTNIPLSGADFKAVGVAEPEVRLHFGNVTPMAGVILPFAGPLTDPYFIGVRIGLAGRF